MKYGRAECHVRECVVEQRFDNELRQLIVLHNDQGFVVQYDTIKDWLGYMQQDMLWDQWVDAQHQANAD